MENEKHYSFFQNNRCEYFPCHSGVKTEDFNCLFCYCPLYALGKGCGGNFVYTEKGIKSCESCTFPHRRENYEKLLMRYKDIKEAVRRSDDALAEKESGNA